ncbi:Uncharacterised protein [BD1-7 clade bacterium]|uniref:Uncharacterized protein n=1 Tax=BD1-7 clade bacterium TaxID=2029982 RepID=A0A5S9QWB8_9GAMM|nr:Uncharacterised protein [BD1-7 clade bacterium]
MQVLPQHVLELLEKDFDDRSTHFDMAPAANILIINGAMFMMIRPIDYKNSQDEKQIYR